MLPAALHAARAGHAFAESGLPGLPEASVKSLRLLHRELSKSKESILPRSAPSGRTSAASGVSAKYALIGFALPIGAGSVERQPAPILAAEEL